jgi:hypothetical protein
MVKASHHSPQIDRSSNHDRHDRDASAARRDATRADIDSNANVTHRETAMDRNIGRTPAAR